MSPGGNITQPVSQLIPAALFSIDNSLNSDIMPHYCHITIPFSQSDSFGYCGIECCVIATD